MNFATRSKNNENSVNRPVLLKETSKSEIIGRKSLEITTHLGTYRMGGAGFFGLLLDNLALSGGQCGAFWRGRKRQRTVIFA